jgi:hypothetical protein
MKEYIKIRDSKEMVNIKITVEYIGSSKYIYVVNSKKTFEPDSDQPSGSFSIKYDIGLGKDLLSINNCNNSWRFQLINQSEVDLQFNVSIEWYQGINPLPINKWNKNGTIKANDINYPLSDTSIYLK